MVDSTHLVAAAVVVYNAHVGGFLSKTDSPSEESSFLVARRGERVARGERVGAVLVVRIAPVANLGEFGGLSGDGLLADLTLTLTSL